MNTLEVKLCGFAHSHNVILSIQNKLDYPVCVQSNQLMLDGRISAERFIVTDKETGENLIYQGITVKPIPIDIILQPGEIRESLPLNLNNAYSLEEGEEYEVQYFATLPYTKCTCAGETADFLEVCSNSINI